MAAALAVDELASLEIVRSLATAPPRWVPWLDAEDVALLVRWEGDAEKLMAGLRRARLVEESSDGIRGSADFTRLAGLLAELTQASRVEHDRQQATERGELDSAEAA